MRNKIGSINILGVTHSIFDYKSRDIGDHNNMGKWLEQSGEIIVNSSMPEDVKLATVWHEVIHCVLYSIGESELGANEDFVEKLSRALFQIADLKIKEP